MPGLFACYRTENTCATRMEHVCKWHSDLVVVYYTWNPSTLLLSLGLLQMLLTGDFPVGDANRAFLQRFGPLADSYACAQIPPFNRVQITPGGLIFIRGVNSQYVTNAAFMLSVYSDVLTDAGKPGVLCGSSTVGTGRMLQFAKQQVRGSSC